MYQAVAATGTRHARYRGLTKTHLQHVFSAVALPKCWAVPRTYLRSPARRRRDD